MEQRRTAVDWLCRYNHEYLSRFLTERRVTPTVSISLVPSSSQPSPGRLLCSLVDFYPAHTHTEVESAQLKAEPMLRISDSETEMTEAAKGNSKWRML
ncbi:H-2 class II histocompatibility antigen, E-S beta chain [Lonchura striata]|uniref:H-2 class II histocompatibility antigen, E-S beta chain n=1 Tax=Lonchura striata TaxID=40157 RepID=A0A218U728_9PASE|nr:H-2 class II histocompatibility antigen, E-S beta chain [Lonchura striata domestica]